MDDIQSDLLPVKKTWGISFKANIGPILISYRTMADQNCI